MSRQIQLENFTWPWRVARHLRAELWCMFDLLDWLKKTTTTVKEYYCHAINMDGFCLLNGDES